MPFYDLKCSKCNNEFNIMAKMSERENNQIRCPQCGSYDLEAIFKNVNIIQSKKSNSGECPNKHVCGGCCGH